MEIGNFYGLFLLVFGFFIHESKTEDVFSRMSQFYQDLSSKYDRYYNFKTWDEMTKPIDVPFRDRIPSTTNYDFIVVGSGSAGATIAARLSEIPHWNVLLIEAGRPESILSSPPLVAPLLQFTPYNWQYYMELQPGLFGGLKDSRMHWPRGRAVGGTSTINYMIYTRGNRHDYDRWAADVDDPRWSYEHVLPYFIKSENGTTLQDIQRSVHGTDGPLSVSNVYQSKLVEAFIQGGGELGLPNFDYNANFNSFGVAKIQATVRDGSRFSHAKAFIYPNLHRPNLHLLTSAYVTKLLIDGSTRRAYGVQYEREGKKYRASASKEVILSAGTFNSPQLLMLAGIGPKEHLEDLGVNVLVDLPVGENLQDHLTYPMLSFTVDRPISLGIQNVLSPRSISEYLVNGTGPWTSLGGVEGIGYVKTELSDDPLDVPDIELLFIGASLATDFGLITRQGMNIRDEYFNRVLRPIQTRPTWTVFPMLLHPKSTGQMRLRSRDPYDYPLFYGNFFTDTTGHDLRTFVAAIRIVQRLAKTDAFRRLGTRINERPVPGCGPYDTDAYWRCAVRALSVTLHHQVGTCRMGRDSADKRAVVDSELRVVGVRGLRVADCSVIPFALGAHTNIPSTMVGERAADLIKKTWLNYFS